MCIMWNRTLFETLSSLFVFRVQNYSWIQITVFEVEPDKDKEFDGGWIIPEVFIVDVDEDSDNGDVLYLYSVQNEYRMNRIWMWYSVQCRLIIVTK